MGIENDPVWADSASSDQSLDSDVQQDAARRGRYAFHHDNIAHESIGMFSQTRQNIAGMHSLLFRCVLASLDSAQHRGETCV